MKIKTDFLIIGSGIAGLSYALHIANKFPNKQVIVLTKSNDNESNTKYAQGGIAAVLDRKHDSFKSHVKDTLKSGDGLCNKEVVKMVVKEGPTRIKELMGLGTIFDRDDFGKLDLIKEGGHSTYRIAHYKDITGFEIQRALLNKTTAKPNIIIYSNHLVISLITNHLSKKGKIQQVCCGICTLDNEKKQITRILSLVTLIATGGAGQVYQYTTNPLVATGDGIAMAYQAGVKVENMEFVQFHPTVLYTPGKGPAFLISESLRGHGAILRNSKQETFMHKYDKRKELASRDIVARAIYKEMKIFDHSHVFLDCRHFGINTFQKRFPNIYQKCLNVGINPIYDMIPIAPAAHYLCGGIKTDMFGRTNIKNLYACGECSCTGLHGANRLASNSLLEAVVFAYKCYEDTIKRIDDIFIKKNEDVLDYEIFIEEKEDKIFFQKKKENIQEIMSKYVGIIRSDKTLKKAMQIINSTKEQINEKYKETLISQSLYELRNIILIAQIIVEQSLERKENKGGFYKKKS